MRNCLIALFIVILAAMLLVTTKATINEGILTAWNHLWPDGWFRATLADAYFAFITFFLWVAYKERSVPVRVVWFILIMLLGNIAMAVYMLKELRKLNAGDSMELLLSRRNGSA